MKSDADCLDVLTDLDVDCTCFAYDLHARQLFVLWHEVEEVRWRCNIANPEPDKRAYMHCLEKYARHGFSIEVPGLVDSLVRTKRWAVLLTHWSEVLNYSCASMEHTCSSFH